MLFMIATWGLCSGIVGVVASKSGRSGLRWTIISMLISPLISGIILFVLLRREERFRT